MGFLDRIKPDSARQAPVPEPAAGAEDAERAEARRLAAELLTELPEAFLVAGAEPSAFWHGVSVDAEPTHWGWQVTLLPMRSYKPTPSWYTHLQDTWLGVTIEGDYFRYRLLDVQETHALALRRLGYTEAKFAKLTKLAKKDADKWYSYIREYNELRSSLRRHESRLWIVHHFVSLADLVDELDGIGSAPTEKKARLVLVGGRPARYVIDPYPKYNQSYPLEDTLAKLVNGYR